MSTPLNMKTTIYTNKEVKMKKADIFVTVFLLPLVFTSCLREYNPNKLQIVDEKAIIRKIQNVYSEYGPFEVISYEKKSVSEMSFCNYVEPEYQKNLAYCSVNFRSQQYPEIEFSATNRVAHENYGEFGTGWKEYYTSNFYSKFYEKQLYEYYNKLLQQNFSKYDYKFIHINVNEYNLSSPIDKFEDFNDFITKKNGIENYYVVLSQDYDSTVNVLLNSFDYQLEMENTNVSYTFVFLPGQDISSINTAEDVAATEADLYKYISYAVQVMIIRI